MKTFLLVIAVLGGISHAGFKVDRLRPHLDSLESRGRLDWADYQGDFLISQSAEITEVPASEVIKRLKLQHEKTKIVLDPQAPKVTLPKPLLEGDQLEALLKCNLEKCDVKLNLESETKKLLQKKDRSNFYEELINQRLLEYFQQKKLKGYENREDNIPVIKKAFETLKFLKTRYPKTYVYLMGDLWRVPLAKKIEKQTYWRSELIRLTGERAQPVFRLVEDMEFEEDGFVMVELHLYTNHFFDSSLRVFEVFPWGLDSKKAVYIVTDVMEVDELKKSALNRKLLKTRLEEAICEYRKSEMKELR